MRLCQICHVQSLLYYLKQPYNTALYMRLSRDDEKYGDSVSTETQRVILRQFASDNNLHVVDEETKWIIEKIFD